ncbi:MAG: FtsX-like permease family protein, partial [Gemmatimonadaceae bacterium]
VGVMGPEFQFPREDVAMWIAYEMRPADIEIGNFSDPIIARVKPGTTMNALATELTAISKQLPQRFGGTASYAKIIEQHRAIVRPITAQLIGPIASSLWVLLGAAAIVLLVACGNVANLFLVRAEGRQRDLAVRRAIGATRIQLIRSQMAEALVIAGLAAGVAAVLAWITLPAFVRAAPSGIPRLASVGMNSTTLLYTLVVAFLGALVCGLIPAIRASAPDMRRLREGGRGSTRKGNWTRDGLVIGQTALALVLLIGSGLLVRSFWELRRTNPGYDTKDVFTFQIAPEQSGLKGGLAYAQFHMRLMERIAALPGVTSVGVVENVPLNESTGSAKFRSDEAVDVTAGSQLNYTFTAGDYFKTMGIGVRAGRPLTNSDQTTVHDNVVVSVTAAKLLWPGKDAVGRWLQRDTDKAWYTVVGVVDDVRQDGYRDAPQALVYYSLVGPADSSWTISSPAYVVKTARATTIAPEIRALVHDVSPFAPMYRTFTMEELAATSMVQLSFTMLALGVASALALILGAVGLYGVLSYVVQARTREIGVRLALGAETGQVQRMVVGQGARIVLIGVGVGALVAGISARSLGSLLYGVAAFDPTTFIAMSLSLMAVGMLASYVPARRASNVDPIESLRGD